MYLQIALAPRSYGYLPEPGSESLLFIKINADVSAKGHFKITDHLNAMWLVWNVLNHLLYHLL